MQLTKDDVKLIVEMNPFEQSHITKRCIDFSKFQQVRIFYETYRDNPARLMEEHPEVVKKLLDMTDRRDKLYDYCFKDGLK